MFSSLSQSQRVGLVFSVFAAVLIFVWIPFDVESGYIEKVRRQVTIGDALAPTIAGGFVLLGGLLLLVFERGDKESAPLDWLAIRFALLLFLVFAVSFLCMWVVGPVVVFVTNLATGADLEYRLLRDTAPWKYLGFAVGGTVSVSLAISLLEGRFTTRSVLIGVVSVCALIAVYDLPFDDLLLPPNGDF